MKIIPSNSQYKSGILSISLIGVSLFLIYFLYSKYTSPDSQIFINNSLYSFALTVLFTSIILIALLFYVIQRTFFSKKNKEQNPQKLIYYLQLPFSTTKFKTIFLISTIFYFIFFAFVSNIFIYFDNNGTAFSIFPKFAKTSMDSMNMSSMNMNMNNNSIPNSGSNNQNDGSELIKYPNTKIIICCNYMGYVPMVIFELNPNFSVFVIPVNTFIGIFVSVLVGFNVSLNIFLLKQLKSLRLVPSKNVLGVLGIGTSLFVGCPTCAGNLFYSLAGFSSLVAFSSLNTFQIIFVFATIPLLIFSIWFMIKQLKKNYLNTCAVSKSKDIK